MERISKIFFLFFLLAVADTDNEGSEDETVQSDDDEEEDDAENGSDIEDTLNESFGLKSLLEEDSNKQSQVSSSARPHF